jgi:hypothetical protein
MISTSERALASSSIQSRADAGISRVALFRGVGHLALGLSGVK